MLWSVGCSQGEEPYTLAMVLSEFSERYPGLDFNFQILATDAVPSTLQAAERGIYYEDQIGPVPMGLRKKYLLKSRDRDKKLIRVVSELREFVKFRNVDFLDEDLKFRESIDIIFCRDLLDRVEKTVRMNLLQQFYQHLSPGGYLFLGQSENLHGMDLPLVQEATSIFRKQ